MSAEWLPRILVADDEVAQRNILGEILRGAGHDVALAGSVDAALETFRAALATEHPYDLVLTDLKMPGRTEGLTLLAKVKELSPLTEVVLMTAYAEVKSAVEAMKIGAFEYLEKPFDRDRLLRVVGQAAEKLVLVAENRRLRALIQEGTRRGRMIGTSLAMQQLFDTIARVAPISTTCLIRGESGTGKELVARAIHQSGPRAAHPFIAINCAAIPETLIESELYGHDKGAFTGATVAKAGRFDEVGEGTLFLDEIGSMKFDLQAKLLRVIQEREFSRVGTSALIPFRGRILAATAQDLEASIAENRFREDLYFRLNVMPIEIPPLRERVEDIPLLVSHFVEQCGARLAKKVRGVTPAVLEILEQYPWPGNVRELENVIERMLVLADDEWLEERLLPRNIRRKEVLRFAPAARAESAARNGGAGHAQSEPFQLPARGVVMEELEMDLIRQALSRTGGRIEPAAQLLGITYKTLQYRIKKYNLRPVPDGAKREIGNETEVEAAGERSGGNETEDPQ